MVNVATLKSKITWQHNVMKIVYRVHILKNAAGCCKRLWLPNEDSWNENKQMIAAKGFANWWR